MCNPWGCFCRGTVILLPDPSTHTVYQYKIVLSLFWGRYGHIGKWIQENIIFMQFCCCFKLSKKTEKVLNEQLTHAIAKCTLTGLGNRLRNLIRSEIWSCACVFSTTALLPSTATCAGWNSKWCCHQWKNKRPWLAEGKCRFTNSGLRFTPKRGWQLCDILWLVTAPGCV